MRSAQAESGHAGDANGCMKVSCDRLWCWFDPGWACGGHWVGSNPPRGGQNNAPRMREADAIAGAGGIRW